MVRWTGRLCERRESRSQLGYLVGEVQVGGHQLHQEERPGPRSGPFPLCQIGARSLGEFVNARSCWSVRVRNRSGILPRPRDFRVVPVELTGPGRPRRGQA